MNQGAIQIQVTIAGKSISISKSHLISLHVKRVIGDSADDFTLEVFDETAIKVENLLIGSNFPTITVQYSSSKTLTKTVIFTGVCLDYNISFVGRAMMLSITGILMTTGDVHDGWWFDRANIEWCGNEIQNQGSIENPSYAIDGKNASVFRNYKNNRDVCAIVVSETDDQGNTTNRAYFNPGRIFQRIIHKYNGDKLGSTTGYNSGSYDASVSGQVDISDVTDFTWKYFQSLGFTQECTAAIMGNIQQESSFVPNSLQNKTHGPAAGLFQWENYDKKTSRWLSLSNFAKDRGKSWTDTQTQLDFAMTELAGCLDTYTGPNGAHGTYDNGTPWGWPYQKLDLAQYKAYKNVNEATEIFSRCFCRPSKPLMDKRKQYANNFLARYKNKNDFADLKEGGVYTTTKNALVHNNPSTMATVLGTISIGESVTVTVGSTNNWVKISYTRGDGSILKGWINGADLTNDSYAAASTLVTVGDDGGGEIEGWGTNPTGSTKYVIAECDDTRWVADLDTHQFNETAAQYITRVLCKAAVTDTGVPYSEETAGFKYWCDAKGHHFKALNYNDKSVSKIDISYGLQNSEIISFNISDIGSIAMVWGDKNKRNKVVLSASATSDLFGDIITVGGENVLGASLQVDKSVLDSSKAELNWYLDAVPAITVKSSTSQTDLDNQVSSTYNDLSEYAITAELTLWGEYAKTYSAGDFVDLIVSTASGKRHYSSGIYMITSLEDDISNSGYTQTMRLLKNVGRNVTSSSTSNTLSTPDLTVDGKGNIIATYTKTTKNEESTSSGSSIPKTNNRKYIKQIKKLHIYSTLNITQEQINRDKEYDEKADAYYEQVINGKITEEEYKKTMTNLEKEYYG